MYVCMYVHSLELKIHSLPLNFNSLQVNIQSILLNFTSLVLSFHSLRVKIHSFQAKIHCLLLNFYSLPCVCVYILRRRVWTSAGRELVRVDTFCVRPDHDVHFWNATEDTDLR